MTLEIFVGPDCRVVSLVNQTFSRTCVRVGLAYEFLNYELRRNCPSNPGRTHNTPHAKSRSCSDASWTPYLMAFCVTLLQTLQTVDDIFPYLGSPTFPFS